MHHCLLISLGVILTLTSIHSLGAAESIGAEALKLPADAAALMQGYETDVAKLEADCAKSVAAKADALRIKLTKAQEGATKKGDLDGALAIKAAIEKLSTEDSQKSSPGDKPALPHSSRDVILYAQVGFKGPGTILKQFDVIIDVYKLPFPNDGLRSIKVPAGMEVVTYAGDAGGGAEYVINGDVSDLTSTPAIQTTSLMLRRVK